MVISKNFIIKGSITKFSLINIVSFVFLAWIYNTHNDKCNFDNFRGIEGKHIKTIDTVLFRSLAKHGFKEVREHEKLKEKISYDGDNLKAKNFPDARSTYRNLKKGKLNELELYIKNFNHRYTKKKGLKKLDCYWENKIFDKFEYVNNLAEKKQDSKKRFIKIILNKYSIFLTLFALLPILGLIIPLLIGHKYPTKRYIKVFFGDCIPSHKDTENSGVCKYNLTHYPKEAKMAIFCTNAVFTYTSLIVVILIFFYIYVKYIKYEFLKAGKGNITLKEFVRLLKHKL